MNRAILKYGVLFIALLFVVPAISNLGNSTHAGIQTNSNNKLNVGPLAMGLENNHNTQSNNTTVRVSPPVNIPKNVVPINYTIANDYVTTTNPPTTPGKSDSIYYNVTLPNTSWEAIILNYSGASLGTVYDTRAWMSVDNVTVFRGIVPEAGSYDVVVNLTSYDILFHGSTRFYFSPPADAVKGEYISNVSVSLYAGPQPPGLPNVIKSIVPIYEFSTTSKVSDTSHAFNMTVPTNTSAATLQVWVTSSGVDEFWYSNEPSYRSVQIWSGDHLIANILPFYKVRTGGIDLYAWRPLTSPFELDDRPYNVNVTAALGLLEHSNNITIKINGSSPLGGYWIIRVNLLMHTSSSVTGAVPIEDHAKFSSPTIITDMTLPCLGSASKQSYFYELVQGEYGYSSLIETIGGSMLVSKHTTEVSFMYQSVNSVWENITGYQYTDSIMKSIDVINGTTSVNTHTKISYFPIKLQEGFAFAITQTTNGTYPMYGNFTQYLNNMSLSYDVINHYVNDTNGVVDSSLSTLSNSVYTNGDLFSGVIELKSPVAGLIVSLTAVKGVTMKIYTQINFKVSMSDSFVLYSYYQHIIKAVSNNPPGPNYFGTIIMNNTYYYNI